mmetsp:Transcript_13643/g.38747  ORF Transcript_13643/g.38747 Transcript_13643/m.38747 type:complete len:434 (-) Transcript_13643:508-1809(-)
MQRTEQLHPPAAPPHRRHPRHVRRGRAAQGRQARRGRDRQQAVQHQRDLPERQQVRALRDGPRHRDPAQVLRPRRGVPREHGEPPGPGGVLQHARDPPRERPLHPAGRRRRRRRRHRLLHVAPQPAPGGAQHLHREVRAAAGQPGGPEEEGGGRRGVHRSAADQGHHQEKRQGAGRAAEGARLAQDRTRQRLPPGPGDHQLPAALVQLRPPPGPRPLRDPRPDPPPAGEPPRAHRGGGGRRRLGDLHLLRARRRLRPEPLEPAHGAAAPTEAVRRGEAPAAGAAQALAQPVPPPRPRRGGRAHAVGLRAGARREWRLGSGRDAQRRQRPRRGALLGAPRRHRAALRLAAQPRQRLLRGAPDRARPRGAVGAGLDARGDLQAARQGRRRGGQRRRRRRGPPQQGAEARGAPEAGEGGGREGGTESRYILGDSPS